MIQLNDQNQRSQDSLIDTLRFLKDAYKTILIFGALGIAVAIGYVVIIPNRFEAVAYIQMAQIQMAQINGANNINPLGVNVEEPALLIARLGSPSSFSSSAIAACGQQAQFNSALATANAIQLTPIKGPDNKGLANVVALKTFGPSPEAASICAQAIFELIKTSQAQILAPFIEEARTQLADDKIRLDKAKELVAKADRFGVAMSAVYLPTRDEIKYLLDEMTALQNMIASSHSRTTRLVAPIYARESPTSPKKSIALLVGLVWGLLLGLLIALSKQMWAKLKSQNNEAGGVL
ncbi:hypothetical protein G6719_01685 [Polynucleobacter paneuropaeus]|nr:hypothetical protein G6719_01685 [Polynucleobacter paneuropaeus]